MLHVIEIGRDPGQVVVLLLQIRNLQADRVRDDLLIERTNALTMFLADFRHHFDTRLQFLAEALDRFLDYLLPILG